MPKVAITIISLLNASKKLLVSEALKLVKLILTAPATNAVSERSCSGEKQKTLKTYEKLFIKILEMDSNSNFFKEVFQKTCFLQNICFSNFNQTWEALNVYLSNILKCEQKLYYRRPGLITRETNMRVAGLIFHFLIVTGKATGF